MVLAGRDADTFTLTTNEIYSAPTDKWRTGAPVPTGRSGVAAVALDGMVYLVGGEAPTGTFDEAERYDPLTDAWATLPAMPTARHGLGAAAVGGMIYVVSGGPQPGFSFSGANERFDPR
jgi:N-acetylneuraminic acid mutarotase